MSDPLSFLAGGGVSGALARSVDWTKTPLGDPAGWPQSLKTTVATLLHSRHPMFLWWGPELIQFYNDAYLPSFGVGKHPAAMGQRGADCWQEIWPIIWPQIEDVMLRGKASWNEDQLVPIFRNGRIEEVYWTYGYSPVYDDAGAIGGTLVVCTETTKRVLADNERQQLLGNIRAEQHRLATLFSQAPAFMGVLEGPNHVFTLANERYSELVGGRELIGKPVDEALPEVRAQGFIDLLDKVYRTGEPFIGNDVSVQLVQRAGEQPQEHFVDFVYQAVRGADGAITGVLVHGVDQTERHRATAAIQESDRRKDEFLAMLAHELRNPLAPIANYVRLLDRLADDPAAIRQSSAVMGRQVDQIVRLIDDLLDVSRINSGKIELRRGRVSAESLVRQAAESLRPYYDERRVELVITLPGQPVTLDADAARIVQVVGNLLHNAAKFTDTGGHVSLALERVKDEAVIRVRDDGIGIAQEDLARIFAMFTQADTSLERARAGLGIGLALVSSLVEMHGGTTEARSDGPGKGSEFIVRLPVAGPAPDATDAGAGAVPAGAPSRRILVVDDNRDACDSMVMLLSMSGHDVRAAYDGASALQEAETQRPEVVLLDLGMPDMNGYEVCERLRAQPWSAGTMIVALTGWGQDEDKRRTEGGGFDSHLVKPVNSEALERLLERGKNGRM